VLGIPPAASQATYQDDAAAIAAYTELGISLGVDPTPEESALVPLTSTLTCM
jgi:hypothetical protein